MGQIKRKPVEEVAYIDVQDVVYLKKNEVFIFKNSQSLVTEVKVFEDYCFLNQQQIQLAKTKNGYGYRRWFTCPGCTKRYKKLYVLSSNYACRNCHQLIYTKSQLSGNELEYITQEIRAIQRELGVTEDNSVLFKGYPLDVSAFWLPVYKPKYMRWGTFSHKRTLLELMMLKRVEILLDMDKEF